MRTDSHTIPAATYEPGRTYQIVIPSTGKISRVSYSMHDKSPDVAKRIHWADVPRATGYMLYDSDGRALLGEQSWWEMKPFYHHDGEFPYWDVNRFMVLRFTTSPELVTGTYEIHVDVYRLQRH